MPGIQVTIGLGFFLYSLDVCVDCDSLLYRLSLLAVPNGITLKGPNRIKIKLNKACHETLLHPFIHFPLLGTDRDLK